MGFEYKSENVAGNFHSVAALMNSYWAPRGWRLVVAEYTGFNSVIVMEREIAPVRVFAPSVPGKPTDWHAMAEAELAEHEEREEQTRAGVI